MKVFRFYPCVEIWKISRAKENDYTHHLYRYVVLLHTVQVWGIVYLAQGIPEPLHR